MSPSTMSSSTPVTVIVCGLFQFAVVNWSVLASVNNGPLNVASEVSNPVNEMVTLVTGWALRTMVNVDEPPCSVVKRCGPFASLNLIVIPDDATSELSFVVESDA